MATPREEQMIAVLVEVLKTLKELSVADRIRVLESALALLGARK